MGLLNQFERRREPESPWTGKRVNAQDGSHYYVNADGSVTAPIYDTYYMDDGTPYLRSTDGEIVIQLGPPGPPTLATRAIERVTERRDGRPQPHRGRFRR